MPLRLETIQGPYLQDLLHQPDALRDTWTRLEADAIFKEVRKARGDARFQRVVLTGMGSSFFALHPLSIELAANGWTPLMLESSELIHTYPRLLLSSTLVIAVSQSGRSAEIVRMLELNAGKATVIAVTNDPAGPLATQAAMTVLTAAGSEFSVSCKTYVATLLALQAVAASLCGIDAAERLERLEPAASVVEAYLRNWEEHVAEFVEILRDVHDLFFVGRGASLAAAQTGALIIKESDHVHAEGMSSAAFRHGPFDMLKAGMFVGVFAGDEKTRALNRRFFDDAVATGAQAVYFSADAPHGACSLPQSDALLQPIVEILPAQMITLALAVLRQREPGRFVRSTKVTSTE